ncbi:MAG TPA: Appr-1-p processing protein [Cyanobacteria bacterium UBA8803]|nr:Appr-1-p processing protein [Cyanobacteria bacterium UBA9273]HBL60498.1 Appr-1-p processing protein [Cyanobacteria bacterium UBA8803]
MKVPTIDLIPLRTAVATDAVTTLDVLVRITPPEAEINLERPTLNIGLVIDRSGSMQGQKIEYARQASCYAVEQLLPTDRISVTIYDDLIETIVPSTLAKNKAQIIRQLQGLQPRNMTALHAGWREGGMQVSQHLNPEHLNRVMLLSDGLANVGETNPDVIAADVRGLSHRGVSTTTLGVGDDYNEDLMEAIARNGDGNYYYIQSPDQLPNLFAKELLGLLSTFGTTVTLGIKPQAGVTLVEVLNELNVNAKGRYQLPNLIMGNPIDVVVRLKVPPTPQTTDLCRFRLAWNNPKAQERQKLRVTLHLPSVPKAELDEFPFNPEVRQQAALMMAARAKKEAVRLVDRGEYDTARQLLQQTKQQILSEPDLPMAAPEAAALDDLDKELQARNVVQYRKMSTFQTFRRSSSHSRGHFSLFYAYGKGPILGDITQCQVDAIVNSTDIYLSDGGAISSAIHRAAGSELLAACQQLHGCAVGEAKITSGYNLPAQWVIHTVAPPWHGGHKGEEQLLAKCYRHCLELAVQQSCRRIAFPAIGVGALNFPKEIAAQVAFKETSRFLLSNSSIGEVMFVCFDEEIHRCYLEEFQKIAGW